VQNHNAKRKTAVLLHEDLNAINSFDWFDKLTTGKLRTELTVSEVWVELGDK
jgi:hypothetical protein